jgi:hypothetical protein
MQYVSGQIRAASLEANNVPKWLGARCCSSESSKPFLPHVASDMASQSFVVRI